MNSRGSLYTISAPSGAGKTSLVKGLLAKDAGVCVSVSHTTRPQRTGEVEGIDYYFVTSENFADLANQDQMLEHALVFGNQYGTSRMFVEQTLAKGNDVILEIDWQGRDQVLAKIPDAIAITILPPSRDILLQRLSDRGTDNQDVIANRMDEATTEIGQYASSHYLIVNAEFEQALDELATVFASERLRTARQQIEKRALINNLLAN